MSDEISSNSADLYNKLSAAIGKQSGKISESAEQVNLSVFKDNDPIKGKIQDALLKFRRNNGNNEISSLNKPAENHINPDGSGTKVTQKTDKNGNVITETVTMGPGGKVLSKNSMVKNKNGKMINNTTTSYTYDKSGKLQKTQTSIINSSGIRTQEDLYGSDGKVQHRKEELTTFKGGKKLKSKAETDFNYMNGKLSSTVKKGTDIEGHPYEVINNYEEDGNTLKNRSYSYYKRGALHKDYYEGENLTNRTQGGLPSTRIVYEEDGKTVKETIKNEFDENGVLIGREKYDKNGNLIEKHDFSKVDGHFDTAYQIGKGDCYLLASINALSQTEEGQEILRQNITESVNENGEKVYTITFPGAEIARDSLINGTGEVNMGKLPADKVHIQGSYTVTEAELEAAAKCAGKDYSAGDKDVLLYEIAYEKYRKDVAQTIKDNNINPRKTQYIAGLGIANVSSEDKLSGGNAAEATFILTGRQSDTYIPPHPQKAPTCYIDADMNMHVTDESGNLDSDFNEKAMAVMVNNKPNNDVDGMLADLREDSRDGKIDNYAATAGFTVSSQEVNGQVISGGGHALTIVKVTDDEVVLSNPWDPDTNITMTIDEFKKAATLVTCIELNPQEQAQSNQNNSNDTGGKIQSLLSRINSQQPSRPALTSEQRENLISFAHRYIAQHGITPSKANVQKILNALRELNPDAVKTENGEMYLDAGTEINLPDFDDI